MAKKVVKKPAKQKGGAKKGAKAQRKQNRRAVERTLGNGPFRKPKATPRLPGLERISADAILGDICKTLREILNAEAEARETKAGLRANALQRLKKIGRTSYLEHGISLVLVPGDEKLNIKAVKADGLADQEREDDDLNEPVDNGAPDEDEDEDGDDAEGDGDTQEA
jgi:hypothetical protein